MTDDDGRHLGRSKPAAPKSGSALSGNVFLAGIGPNAKRASRCNWLPGDGAAAGALKAATPTPVVHGS